MSDALILYQYDTPETPFLLSREQRAPKKRGDGSQPSLFFWKEMARPGPIVDSKGITHDVTLSRLQGIHDNTKRLMAKGYEPYLPLGGHMAGKATSVGYIVDLRMDPDGSFHGLHEFIGPEDETLKLVARQKSSLGTIANVHSSDGEILEEVLDHNAILPDPQLDDLGPFIPADITNFEPALAASRGLPVEAVTLRFDRGNSHTGANMAMQTLTPEHVTKIKKIVGDHEGVETGNAVTDDNAIDSCIAHCDRMHAKPKWAMSREDLDAAKTLTGMENLSPEEAGPAIVKKAKELSASAIQLSRDLKEAEKVKSTAEARVLELSRDSKAPAPPTAREINYASIAVQAAKHQALTSGAITPFVAEQAEAKFLKRPVDFKTLTLSRDVQASDASLLDGMDNLVLFFQAVQGNTPSPITDQGQPVDGGNVMQLGRHPAPGADPKVQKALEAQWEAEEKAAKEQRMNARVA